MPVEDVGIGVGYFSLSRPYFEGDARARFAGRGKQGEENGSNAGSSDGAGRLTPETELTRGSEPFLSGGEEFMLEGIGSVLGESCQSWAREGEEMLKQDYIQAAFST